MARSFIRKLTLFVTLTSLLGMALIITTAYRAMDASLTTQFRLSAADASAQLASRVSDEFQAVAQRARFYVASAESGRFGFETDNELIALTLLRRTVPSAGETNEAEPSWTTVLRWTRPPGDPSHLEDADFADIELKHPLNLAQTTQGRSDLVFGTGKNISPFFRMAIPFGTKALSGYEQAVVIEVKQQKLLALFSDTRGHVGFLAGPEGHLITSNEAGHFLPGEDLSRLAVLAAAQNSNQPHGSLDYSETPGGTIQYASFYKISAPAKLVVVTQIPRTRVVSTLSSFVSRGFAAAIGTAVMIALICSFLTWKIIGLRLTELRKTIDLVRNKVSSSTDSSSDDFESVGNILESICQDLERHEVTQGVTAKFKNPELKAKFDEGAISMVGERVDAVVLDAHLQGIEALVSQADPQRIIALLNTFNQVTSRAVEAHGGLVDHIHGGSVVAYWGVPISHTDDADCALAACLEIREAASRLNESLEQVGLPPLKLGMGMHSGPVVVGQVGAPGRLEYSALGDAIEMASRIHSFTDQLGTDFLMTRQVATKLSGAFVTESVTAGDELTPELFELVRAA